METTTNNNLIVAKKVKNDEFYTQMETVESELKYYWYQLEGKTVYCNCDREESNFVKYLKDNFNKIGLKKLLVSHVDFRSNESINKLKECDIVITNPPFSLLREYVEQLIEYDKKFLIIVPNTMMVRSLVFERLLSNEFWIGFNNKTTYFIREDNSLKDVGIYWLTNIEHNKKFKNLNLKEIYHLEDYPNYDNYMER